MYAKAVWMEESRETEGTVPINWVDREKGVVMWPKNKATKAFKLKQDPEEDWLSFKLIKIKMTSGMFCFWIFYQLIKLNYLSEVD